MVIIKSCTVCGVKYTSKGKKSIYCNNCHKTYCYVCDHCGKEYYDNRKNKSINNKNQYIYKSCSHECSMILLHIKGIKFYWKGKAFELKLSHDEYINYINKLHNIDLLTIKYISELIGCSRISLDRFCKSHNIKTRNISEDNHRRYKNMSDEDKKKQTLSSNKAIREYFKNDKWKAAQIKKILESQNYRSSKPELFFVDILNKCGFTFETQFQVKWWLPDIAFPELKLSVEIDGKYWHSLPKTIKRDKTKDAYMKAMGWTILRFDSLDVFNNPYKYILIINSTICDILGD